MEELDGPPAIGSDGEGDSDAESSGSGGGDSDSSSSSSDGDDDPSYSSTSEYDSEEDRSEWDDWRDVDGGAGATSYVVDLTSLTGGSRGFVRLPLDTDPDPDEICDRARIRNDEPGPYALCLATPLGPPGDIAPVDEWEKFGRDIRNNTHLRTLQLCALNMRDRYASKKGAQRLFQGIAANRSIRALKLDSCRDSDGEIFRRLNPLFEETVDLLSLRVRDCEFNSKGLRRFSRALEKFCSLTTLEYSMREGGVREHEDGAVERFILAAAGHTHLRNLSLKGLPIMTGGYYDASIAALADLMLDPTSWLISLDLTDTDMDDGAVVVLMRALEENNGSLGKLILGSNCGISDRGWSLLFGVFGQSPSAIEHLGLSECFCPSVLDEFLDNVATSFGHLLNSPIWRSKSLKVLDLSCNGGISARGWMAVSALLKEEGSALERLVLRPHCREICERVLHSFASSLRENHTLKELILHYTARHGDGWEALARALCDASSIADTHGSNHTLERLTSEESEGYLPRGLRNSLKWNRNNGKFESRRLKILECHVGGDYVMGHFADMDTVVLPHAVAWLALGGVEDAEGNEVGGVSVLYRFVRNMHHLFDRSKFRFDDKGPRRKRRRARS